jgi:CCR4-NOT transcriptional complex subunit CAF120
MSQWSQHGSPTSPLSPTLPESNTSSARPTPDPNNPRNSQYRSHQQAQGIHDWRNSVRSSANHTPLSSAASPNPEGDPISTSRAGSRAGSRTGSRPVSMVQTFHPPVMEVMHESIPELQPVFTFINSHSSKLYQEGYFLKLHDLDSSMY